MMKSVYPKTPVVRQKPKKQANLKSVAAANIAQRYMELLRLRAQVHKVKEK